MLKSILRLPPATPDVLSTSIFKAIEAWSNRWGEVASRTIRHRSGKTVHVAVVHDRRWNRSAYTPRPSVPGGRRRAMQRVA